MLNKAIKKAKENKQGFTLAELLIVVAIIAVLVAISIPIFTSQLEKSKEAVDVANLRAAYALAMADAITDQPTTEQTKYYSNTGAWVEKTAASKGKGTTMTTSTTYDLPANTTYTSSDATTGMVIEVKYSATGVTSCKFVS